MKPSTAAELVGFTLLVAWSAVCWGVPGGLLAAGIACLLVGYATEDQTAGLAVGRIVNPLRARVALRRAARRQRRATKKAAKSKG